MFPDLDLSHPAGRPHPQIGVRRCNNLKRHPEISPLSPAIAPTVLHQRKLLRKIVTQAKYFMAALLRLARLGNRHDPAVRQPWGHERLIDRETNQHRPRRWIG